MNNKIKFLRQEAGLTQEELSKKINITPMAIRNWESGSKAPSASSLIALAEVFGVSTDYILGVAASPKASDIKLTRPEISLITNYRALDDHGKKLVIEVCNIERDRTSAQKLLKNTTSLNTNYSTSIAERYIPLYTNPSAAGLSAPLDGDDFEMILVDSAIPKNADFAVKIQGNSMYPVISDGDIVYVGRTEQLSNGDVGIFSVDGSMYCKQYYIDGFGNLTLRSANPNMQSANVYISVNSDIKVKCYGKVLL